MSNVIAFLESMGKDATLKPASDGYADAVASLDVDDAARSALLAADTGALGDLLGGRPKMICMLFPADDDQKKDDEEPVEPQPGEDKPTQAARH